MAYFQRLNTNNSLVEPHISCPPSNPDAMSPSCTFAPTFNSQGSKEEKVIGFKASICTSCLETMLETQYQVDESGKNPKVITKNSHGCFCPMKPSTLEAIVIKVINYVAKSAELPLELTKVVSKWTNQNTCLVAFKVPVDKVKGTIIDINVPSRLKPGNDLYRSSVIYPYEADKNWALRVIKNGQMFLDGKDLIDFIRAAQNKTSGFFRVHRGQEDVAQIYCIFVSKGPLPNGWLAKYFVSGIIMRIR